jgi:hypothetical protein
LGFAFPNAHNLLHVYLPLHTSAGLVGLLSIFEDVTPNYCRQTCLKKKKKKKKLIACRGLGRVVGPLLAARALPLRCAASTMLSSTLLAI